MHALPSSVDVCVCVGGGGIPGGHPAYDIVHNMAALGILFIHIMRLVYCYYAWTLNKSTHLLGILFHTRIYKQTIPK